jgi:hypothetical protein
VSGAQAAAGQIHLGSSSRRVTGALGGHSFDLSLAKVRLSRAGSDGEWPAAPLVLSRLGRERLAPALSPALTQLP